MALAGFLVLIVAWIYSWGINTLIRHISVALNENGEGVAASELSLDVAKSFLRERGFIE